MRLLCNFGLDGSIPWFQITYGAICFISKEDIANENEHYGELLRRSPSLLSSLLLKKIIESFPGESLSDSAKNGHSQHMNR